MAKVLTAPASRYEVPSLPDLNDVSARRRLSAGAVPGMQELAERWRLTTDDICLLLDTPPSTWFAWRKKAPADLGRDRLTRVSFLLGIYVALHSLHSGPLADEWVRLPNRNPLFLGETPLSVMQRDGLVAMHHVRALLDARRGGR